MTTTQADKLSVKLNDGIVTFTYRKTNNEVRYAVGTTDTALVPSDKQPAPGKTLNLSTPTIQRYYDFIKQDWRSLKKDAIIRITTAVKK